MLITIQNYTLQDIISGIQLQLDRAAHSIEVRDLAIQINSTESNPISTVFDWIKKNVKYVSDPVKQDGIIELFISPVKMAIDYKNGQALAGDCDDMAILATALYRQLGMQSNVIILNLVGQGYDHAISRVYSEQLSTFIMIDPSANFPLGWVEQSVENIIVP